MNCPKFEQTTEHTTGGELKDSCSRCGRTHKAHTIDQEVRIKYGGKLWIFKNWEEAHALGFYVGD